MNQVFVLGASRSGTSLLNSILLSSGVFAIYEAEPLILTVCQQKYGRLSSPENRALLQDDFLRSRQFKRSGLTAEDLHQVIESCSADDYFGFLEKFMDLVAKKQSLDCWSDSTPANVFFMEQVLKRFPSSKFVHVVRDGRDVALSKKKLGWTGVSEGLSATSLGLMGAAVQWEMSARLGHKVAKQYPERCLEVRYEDLVSETESTLKRLEEFLSINLIGGLESGPKYGSLREANSSFGALGSGTISSVSVGRWEGMLEKNEKAMFSVCFADTLRTFAYPVDAPPAFLKRLIFVPYYCLRSFARLKNWLRYRSVWGKVSQDSLEIGLD